MTHRLLPLGAALLCAATAPAQGALVSPIEWTALDAPGGNAFPLASNSTPYRYLQVHDDLIGAAGTITGIAFRRSGTTSTTEIAAFNITLDAYLSTAATTGASVAANYDANHGPDRTQVIQGRTYAFPAVGTGTLPYDFAYSLPFDTPFPFAGSGSLAWEFQITARSSNASPLILDAANNSGPVANPSMIASKYGLGCTATGRSAAFTLTGASNNDWPGGTVELTATAQTGPANASSVLFVGLDPVFAGVSIPLPGTETAPSGTCFLQTAPLAQILGTLTSAGGLTFRVTAPGSASLHGLQVYSQVFAADVGANPWNVVSSNGLDHQVIAPIATAVPGGRVYATSSGINPTGIADDFYALVVQFTY